MQSKTATKGQIKRFQDLREVGCIACLQHSVYSEPDIHHLVEGGKRLGHDSTIPLCPWHHRGIKPVSGLTLEACERFYGPSLAQSKRKFVEQYGSERALLSQTNRQLSKWRASVVGAKGSVGSGSFFKS